MTYRTCGLDDIGLVSHGLAFCQFLSEKNQKTGHNVASTWDNGPGMGTIAKSVKFSIGMMACESLKSLTWPLRRLEVLTCMVGAGLHQKHVGRNRSRGGGDGGMWLVPFDRELKMLHSTTIKGGWMCKNVGPRTAGMVCGVMSQHEHTYGDMAMGEGGGEPRAFEPGV